MVKSLNWRKYKILLKKDSSQDDINLTFSKSKPKSNKVIDKIVEECWCDTVKGKKSVGQKIWDNKIYRLQNIKSKKDSVHIVLGLTSYKYLQGTNATNWIIGDMYGKDYLANAILVQGVVQTSDDKLILGKRNTGVKSKFEQYAIFGGTADEDEGKIRNSKDLFGKMILELKEEIGITENDIKKIMLKYVVEDWKYYPVFYFSVKLNLDAFHVMEKFKKLNSIEHSDIVFKSKNEIYKRIKKNEESFTDLTLLGLHLFKRANYST